MRFFKRNSLKSSEIDLGSVVFNVETRHLRDHSGQEIALRHQSREVLSVLMHHRGNVVTRRALAEAAWDVPIVSDDSIAQCIADIRRTLSDRSKRIVETVPRQGYRLILPPGCSPARPRSDDIGRAATVSEAPAPEARAPVIEVLPFEGLGLYGAVPSALCNVLAEAIVTNLARYPEMTVRHGKSGPDTFADRLSVLSRPRADYLVTGTLASDGQFGRLSVRLVAAGELSCLWVEEIDFDLGELLVLSCAIGRQVASAVGVKLVDLAAVRIDRGEVSAMLIENAARSRMLRHVSAEAFHRNIRDQETAIERYPDSPWGLFGQALALRTGIENGWLTRDVQAASARAEDLVARALVLDPDNYLVHYALGKTLAGKGETERAILAFESAGRLNPSSTMILVGQITPNLNIGNTARALELIAATERISPHGNRHLAYQTAKTWWRMGDPNRALRSLISSPGLTDDQLKLQAVVHVELGRTSEARAALARLQVSNPHWTLRNEASAQRAQATPLAVLERWLSCLSEAGMPL